jgi:dihydrofolate reductase
MGMRKLILQMSVSLDGFVTGPEGVTGWTSPSHDAEVMAWKLAALESAGTHVMGRSTYEEMAAHWPASTEPYAKPMNEIPKVVFSKNPSVTSPESWATTQAVKDASSASGTRVDAKSRNSANEKGWGEARVMSGDLTSDIALLKSEPGKDIMAHGGAGFARSLVRLGLVDEYQLLVHPVARGQGLPLFSDLPKPIVLHLVSATTFPGGAVAHVYRPAKER